MLDAAEQQMDLYGAVTLDELLVEIDEIIDAAEQ